MLQGPDGALLRPWCALAFVPEPWNDPMFHVSGDWGEGDTSLRPFHSSPLIIPILLSGDRYFLEWGGPLCKPVPVIDPLGASVSLSHSSGSRFVLSYSSHMIRTNDLYITSFPFLFVPGLFPSRVAAAARGLLPQLHDRGDRTHAATGHPSVQRRPP